MKAISYFAKYFVRSVILCIVDSHRVEQPKEQGAEINSPFLGFDSIKIQSLSFLVSSATLSFVISAAPTLVFLKGLDVQE